MRSVTASKGKMTDDETIVSPVSQSISVTQSHGSLRGRGQKGGGSHTQTICLVEEEEEGGARHPRKGLMSVIF